MADVFQRLADLLGLALPAHGMAAAVVIVLYAVQSEIRFGSKARTYVSGETDRGSTRVVSLSSLVPILGFAVAMKAEVSGSLFGVRLGSSRWLLWPGSNAAIGWAGVGIAVLGVLLRLWAVLTLRERYTRTLLVQENHVIERGGPYRLVRHPGYAGSLLCLNGIALASCSVLILLLSVAATFAAYAYRLRVEDRMLIDRFGDQYRRYCSEVGSIIPFVAVSRFAT